MIETGLKDRTVLLTGGNHGIGAVTAVAFAAQGAKVFINYLRLAPEDFGVSREAAERATTPGLPYYHQLQRQTADAVVQAVREAGGRAESLEADLADPATLPELFNRAEAAFGPVDVLVNNAAHCDTHPDFAPDTIFTTSAAGVDRHFAVNTRGTVLMMAEFVRRYQARGGSWGRIINVSTDAAQTFAGQIAYGASKAAVEAFTRSVAMEVGPLGITVNTVAPGPVQTGYIPPQMEEALLPSIPLRRVGRPDDIADVIVFLASHQARWLTGQVIKVSGGHNL